MADLLSTIMARREYMRMLQAGVMPYTSTGTVDPQQDFYEHAAGDIDWLIGEVQALRTVANGCRAHVAAEELDSSYAATTWGELRRLLGEYDWRHHG